MARTLNRYQLELDLNAAVETIPDRLYWVMISARAQTPVDSQRTHYFQIDNTLVYERFNSDFGPLNLGLTHRYCMMLDKKLNDARYANKRIIHWCHGQEDKRANSAYLMMAALMILKNKTAEEASSAFRRVDPPFHPYRDAGYGDWDYACSILDCLKGLEKAMSLGWYEYKNFDLESYEKFNRIDCGDVHWIIPRKFLAFSGPSEISITDSAGFRTFTPSDYVGDFKRWNVGLVVRLNNPQYDAQHFIRSGINHVDLYFKDGSCPDWGIIKQFLDVCEREPTGVAVHCKAGLGRTGTLIGCYAMKNYKFPSAWWIGWNRICRPGSVLGPQQHFLCEIQTQMFSLGMNPSSLAFIKGGSLDDEDVTEIDQMAKGLGNISLASTLGGRSAVGMYGEAGQGERLVAAARANRQTATVTTTGYGGGGTASTGAARDRVSGTGGARVGGGTAPVGSLGGQSAHHRPAAR